MIEVGLKTTDWVDMRCSINNNLEEKQDKTDKWKEMSVIDGFVVKANNETVYFLSEIGQKPNCFDWNRKRQMLLFML